MSELRQVAAAIAMYRNDRNAFPASLDDIGPYIGNATVIEYCHENGKRYEYRKPVQPYSQETILAFDPIPHAMALRSGRAVVRLSGVASFVKEEDFKREIQPIVQ